MSKIKNAVFVYFEGGMMEILWAAIELGLETRAYDMNCANCEDSSEETEKLIQFIKEAPTDIVFTHDFSPSVSNACQELSIPYASWTFDMPLPALHHPSVYNSCNYIFVFDKSYVNILKRNSVQNLYHLPLAANITRSNSVIIDAEDEKKYSCDVSFVGNIFPLNQKDFYDEFIKRISEESRHDLTELIDQTYGKWDGVNRIAAGITPNLLSDLKKHLRINGNNLEYENLLYEATLAYHISATERIAMLKSLMPFNVRLYSTAEKVDIDGIDLRPTIEYEHELPKAYFLSKINMSITLHSIQSAIPLRVFDILGMCSFCITNYQTEIEELFEPGKDLVVYRSLDEIPELVGYYLKHDEERMKIAASGYYKVRDNYTWSAGLLRILGIIEG